MHDKKRAIAGLSAVSVITITAFPFLVTSLSYQFIGAPADETHIAWLGKQVAAGRIPYRDFFSFLPPAASVLAALPAWLFGPGLVPLRLFVGALILFASLALYSIARTRGATRSWAVIVALWLPLVIFPLWPVATHHWFAICLGLGCLAVIAQRPLRPGGAVMAGALASLAGLVNQSVGLVLGVLFVAALFSRPASRGVRLLGMAGLLAIPAIFGSWLATEGALESGLRQFILWPLRYYRQPGGFNDVVSSEFFSVIPSKISLSFAGADAFACGVVFILTIATLLLLATELLARSRRLREPQDWKLDALILALSAFAFSRSRIDFVHLALWTPFVLPVISRYAAGQVAPLQRAAARTLLVAGILVSIARFAPHWREEPPSAHRLFDTDRRLSAYVRSTVLGVLPGVLEASEPVVLLSWSGSVLYLYWSPAYPPVDWIHAPSAHFTSPDHYAMMAEFIDTNRVRYVIVDGDAIDELQGAPTPIRDLLLSRYSPFRDTPYGRAFRRRTGPG